RDRTQVRSLFCVQPLIDRDQCRLFLRRIRMEKSSTSLSVSGASRQLAFLVVLSLLRWPATLLAAQERVVDPKELPKFPPVAAQEAVKTFQLRKGFHLELVAAEPLVTDPIALAFDEDGRLFVVEMNDYPERGEQRLGQIKRLEDTDGDGH